MSIEIEVRPATFEIGSGGSVVGVIFVTADGQPFPAGSWSDFPLVVLSWWLDSLLSQGTGTKVLRFMEGPYYIEVSGPTLFGAANVRLVDKQNPQNGQELALNYGEFGAEVRTAAEHAAAECERRGWKTADLTALRKSLRDSRRFEES